MKAPRKKIVQWFWMCGLICQKGLLWNYWNIALRCYRLAAARMRWFIVSRKNLLVRVVLLNWKRRCKSFLMNHRKKNFCQSNWLWCWRCASAFTHALNWWRNWWFRRFIICYYHYSLAKNFCFCLQCVFKIYWNVN